MCVCVCVCVCVYIFIDKQIVSLYHKSSVGQDTQDASSHRITECSIFKELYITRMAASNSFPRVFNPREGSANKNIYYKVV